jgi:hypothetical protein
LNAAEIGATAKDGVVSLIGLVEKLFSNLHFEKNDYQRSI